MIDIEQRASLRLIDSNGSYVTLDNVALDKMTTNSAGYETLLFSFLLPSVGDRLPITPKNWVGMVCPYLGGELHGEFFVAEIQYPASVNTDEVAEYKVTCYGMQHIAKTNVLGANINYTTATAPEVIAQDAALEGVVATALGISSMAAATVVDASGITIKQKADVNKNRSVADWWQEILSHGNGVTRFDWSIWVDKNYGLRPNAQRTQIYFTKRNITTPTYYVNREDLKQDTAIVASFNQYWDKASYHYTGASSADLVVTSTAPAGSLPATYTCFSPDGTQMPLTHVYIGELGLAGGDITQTVATAQAQARADSEFAGELTYRLSGSTLTVMPDSIYDATGVRVPNETVRAGNIIRIRNQAIRRNEPQNIDLFITQTSLDLKTGEITLTPQSATDWHTHYSYFYKKKGSHKHHGTIRPT